MAESSVTPGASEASSYDPAYFEHLFAIEDRHFWFRARNRVVTTLVRSVVAERDRRFRMLEVGCGTGVVLQALERAFPQAILVGMDLFEEGLRFAGQRTASQLVQGDAQAPPFGAVFDVVGLFDVLEHLPEDVETLRTLRSLLAPGGALLLTVPAQPSLWSYFDEASHHCRRYGRRELEEKLLYAGYRVEYLTYFMALLYPLLWLGRRVASLRACLPGATRVDADDLARRELRIVPGVNAALAWILAPETRLVIGRRQIPFGTSLLAVARSDQEPRNEV